MSEKLNLGDPCECGHRRGVHRAGYLECLACAGFGSPCNRYTWTDKDDGFAIPHRLSDGEELPMQDRDFVESVRRDLEAIERPRHRKGVPLESHEYQMHRLLSIIDSIAPNQAKLNRRAEARKGGGK